MGNLCSVDEKDVQTIGKSSRGLQQDRSGLKGIGQTERLVSKMQQTAMEELQNEQTDRQPPESAKERPSLNSAGHLMPEEVTKRTKNSIVNNRIILGTSDDIIDVEYAHWTQRGYYPDDPNKENQDEYSITTKFAGRDNDALFAVFDGHGAEGHSCSRFCKKELPKLIAKNIRAQRVKRYKEQLAKNNDATKKLFDPTKWPLLATDDIESCCQKAYVEVNEKMHKDPKVLDKMSGTTATSIFFHGDKVTICNVGDSRAVLGHRIEGGATKGAIIEAVSANPVEEEKQEEASPETAINGDKKSEQLLAIPLSRDQTPYRKDERDRIKKYGATVMSIDQMEGRAPMHDDWGDLVLGKDVDFHGDPPRVWAEGKDYPGCAFTRSIGDKFSEDLGINAEPEMVTTTLTKNDEILVLASDGIFEFVTNQDVIRLCSECETPIEACEKVVKSAYNQWLNFEKRTDDITIIVCFLKCSKIPPEGDDIKGTTEGLVESVAASYGTELRDNGDHSGAAENGATS